MITDLPLLVLGVKDEKSTDIECKDDFTKTCSVKDNLNCWKKCGAVPLTRSGFLSSMVCHEVFLTQMGLLT